MAWSQPDRPTGHPTRRAALVVQLRASALRHAVHARYGGGRQYLERAARVAAGEPVRVFGWEVVDRPTPSAGDYVLEPDGSLAPLRRLTVGGSVRFCRSDGSEVQ